MFEHPVQLATNRKRTVPYRLAPVGICLAAIAILPACGGGPRIADADDWASDVCAAAEDLSEERADALLDFFEVDPDNGEAMYKGFERYIKRYGEALNDFDKAADKAGQPDVKGGDKVREAVRAFATEERKSNEAARKELEGLDKKEDDLAADVDDIFFDIEFADLRVLLEESGAADSGRIIDLIEEDSSCAFALFAE